MNQQKSVKKQAPLIPLNDDPVPAQTPDAADYRCFIGFDRRRNSDRRFGGGEGFHILDAKQSGAGYYYQHGEGDSCLSTPLGDSQ